jgi:sugar lactone lactonase YvrE
MKNFAYPIETVAELMLSPGNITCTIEGRIFLSLHQFYSPRMTVAEWKDGMLHSFPCQEEVERTDLKAVLGIQYDATNGYLWMLDNGVQSKYLPKIVAWDILQDKLARIIYLPPPITLSNSFINDLVIDQIRNVVYISDPIAGNQAALIRVDLNTGLAQRILAGHQSVVPEDQDLIVDGHAVQIKQPDGSLIRPHLGVNGLVLDAENEWLYFCPMHGTSMYRVKSADLANLNLSDTELAGRVERYSDKPICDGISIDQDNNLYLGDLAMNGIGVIKPDRSYQLLVSDERLSWIDSFSFGSDGYLYFNSNQLHKSAPLHEGENISTPPYHIFRLQPLSPGVVGR